MADLPILFSGPMVRALLAGRKTQTRRIIDFPGVNKVVEFVRVAFDKTTGAPIYEMKGAAGQFVTRPAGKHCIDYHYSPRFAVGDRLWVREAWRTESRTYDDLAPSEMGGEETVLYEADAAWSLNKTVGRLRASMHMPRWASRLTLVVADVRVEHVQDISESDAVAEGCKGILGPNPDFPDEWGPTPVEEYRDLWNSLNAERGYGWNANPWVTVTTFDVLRGNIDEVAL